MTNIDFFCSMSFKKNIQMSYNGKTNFQIIQKIIETNKKKVTDSLEYSINKVRLLTRPSIVGYEKKMNTRVLKTAVHTYLQASGMCLSELK